MKNTSLAILALLGYVKASATADETWTTTLASCQDFASKFDNTCSSTTAVAFSSLASATVTCPSVGACAGTTSGDNCSWNRKLCITCRDDSGTIKIRIQSNGLPAHCYKSPQTAPAEQTVDWEVKWLSTATQQSASSPTEQSALNALLCDDLTSPKRGNVPGSAGFSAVSGGDQGTAWGVATSGVLLFSQLSAENVDPFYPAVYANVNNPDDVIEKVDWCLAHPQATGVFHYHSASTCLADAASYQSRTGAMDRDVKQFMQDTWRSIPYQSALGVSKDGRPILTPYKNNGVAWGDCEVDVCNGVDIGGNYMYVTTFFHPYIMGCYGKGSAPELYQQCSSNPRLCNVIYQGAIANTVSMALAGATALYYTLF